MTNNLCKAALAYAARGWFVIPLEIGGKRPHFDLLPAADPSRPKSKANRPTFKPFAEQAASAEQIRAWWEQEPGANVGLICSYTSGLLVVDLDPNKRTTGNVYALDDERRQELLERKGFEESPLVVRTTTGGWHLYYRHPRAPTPVVPKQDHAQFPGVDVQAGKLAIIVAPPSRRSGKRYTWKGTGDPYTTELPPPPTWTIAQESGGHRVYSDAGWRSLALTSDVEEGGSDGGPGRNKTLRSLSLSMAKRGIPLDEALAHLSNWNEQHCKPPLSNTEVMSQVVYMFERAETDFGADGSDTVRLRYNGPSFPMATLEKACPRIYRWVKMLSNNRGTHPDMTASAALFGLSLAATHTIIKNEALPHWEPPCLAWGFTVVESSHRKSAVYKEIMSSLDVTNQVLSQVAMRFNAEIKTMREVLEAAKFQAKAKLRKGKEAADARRDLTDINQQLEELPDELPLAWLTSDITPEKFQVKMASLGWIGLASDEGADILKGFFGHYSGSADLTPVLQSWDRGSSAWDRMGRGSGRVDDSRGAMFAFTQPRVLAGLDRATAEDRGLLARMLFCIPPTDRTVKLPPCDGDPDEIRRDFRAMLLGVYFGGRVADAQKAAYDYRPEYRSPSFGLEEKDPYDVDEQPADEPMGRGLVKPKLRDDVEVIVSKEVWGIFEQLQKEMAEKTAPGGLHRFARSWCGKAGEHAMRLAVVMELAESNGQARKLTEEKALAAVSLIRDYFLYQFYVAIDRMSRPRVAEFAIDLLVRYRSQESFTTTDVVNDFTLNTNEAKELCNWLADRGAISAKGRGRNLTCKVLPGVDY